MLTAADQDFSLRRRIRGYVIGAVLAGLVTGAVALHILLTRDLRMLLSLEIVWAVIAVWIYLGMRYRVLWRNGKIVMTALGRPDTEIAPDEIIQIGLDTAQRMKLAGFDLSSARIKILAKEPAGDSQSIYVSFGHFVPADVLRLMRIISERRPDLAYPRGWIRDYEASQT